MCFSNNKLKIANQRALESEKLEVHFYNPDTVWTQVTHGAKILWVNQWFSSWAVSYRHHEVLLKLSMPTAPT